MALVLRTSSLYYGSSSKSENDVARIITKLLAIEIAKKLKAVCRPKKNSPHDLYRVYYGGRLIAQFGIRRSSQGDIGHDFVPGAISISPRQAKEFAICNLKYEWWVEQMKEKGLIPRDSA